ncbi:hypothetical protein TL16_g03315 [Triparma laevis f. inornata]|uniref:Uncharacterized protein n=1 Tax=Triparma laevis f. inornata TaxID=1714386 RepID=A0A9W7A4C3_9STRA|nr:hypothetical protein TL16_g03315 [Triparma laevis f. inornata]
MQYTRSTSLPGGFQDRLFETWFTWDVVENGDGTRTFIIGLDEKTMIVGYEDTEDDRFPLVGKYILGTSGTFWKLEKLQEVDGIPQTRITYSQMIDLKGFIPKIVMRRRMVSRLPMLSTARKLFEKSAQIDAGRRTEVIAMIGCEEVLSKNGWEDVMAKFVRVFETPQDGWERPSISYGLADSKLRLESGGVGWGSSVVRLHERHVTLVGVDAWRMQNLAVKELMERFEWFEPMAVVLGKGIVKTAAWGLLWRVTIGGEWVGGEV